MALGGRPDHGHPHGLQWKQGPQTSTWPLAISGPLIHSWPSAAERTMGVKMVSGSYTRHSCQRGSPQAAKTEDARRQHRVLMSTWISGFAAAWDSSVNHRYQHGLRWHHRAGGHSRRSNLECKLFLTSSLHRCPKPEDPETGGIFGG